VKRILILFLVVRFFASCTSESIPKGILSEGEMVKILVDIQLTEGMVSAMPIPYDSSQVLYSLMEKEVFIKHEVTDSVFTKSMLYYLEDAKKMDRIYARVIDSLMVRETNPGIEERF
jgi:tRNA(Phe) wybutosine-synthesizing methylase Tyw3